MKRLLVYFSYIGTNYRGLQRTVPFPFNSFRETAPDLESVQGILEFGLSKLIRSRKGQREGIPLYISSRTDVGVHALESTVHFDLNEHRLNDIKGGYSPEKICQGLNSFLEQNECDIRIQRIVEVPTEFNCRRAFSRVYEFRVAILNEIPPNIQNLKNLSAATTIKDLHRSEVIGGPFDLHSVQDACRIFLGQWDYSTFRMNSKEAILPHQRLKTIFKFSVSPQRLPETDWDTASKNLNIPPYDIYNFTVEGSGFLRRQVRRMVGALVGVGRGLITTKDILWMLENPKEANWIHNVPALGPDGLFLKHINYSGLNILRGYLS